MGCPITKDILFDCTDIQVGGIKDSIILINYEQWLAATVTVDAVTKEITDIALAVGGEAFQYSVSKSSNIIATCAQRNTDGIDGFDHAIDCRIMSHDELDARELDKLRFQKVVAIVPLMDGRSRIYGGWADATPEPQGVGLRAMESDDNMGDASIGGTMRVMLKTPDNDPPEIRRPQIIDADFDTSTLLTVVPSP